jgi:hypothetical protein
MEKIVYKVSDFTDFAGQTRQVVMAAVSGGCEIEVFGGDSFLTPSDIIIKEVRLGVAVQNPSDVHLIPNVERAKIIAAGKARKDKSCFGKLYSTDKGFINNKLVDAFLEQEMEYFKQNPGKYLKGYNNDKALFEKSAELYFQKFA